MRINLPSLFLAPAVLAAAAFTSQPAFAAGAATAHIPFDFVASGKALPAGDYMVHPGSISNTVALENPNLAMVWILGPGSPNPSDHRIVLTFDRVGQKHVLRTVQYGPMITNRLDKKYLKQVTESEQIEAGE